MRVDLPTPASALAIAAHPDDVEFNCGATLAKWAESGCVVHHLICTDGAKGTWDVHADTTALVALREDEQREAARRLGATGEVRFLRQVDGELGTDLPLRSEVARIIRELTPAVVLARELCELDQGQLDLVGQLRGCVRIEPLQCGGGDLDGLRPAPHGTGNVVRDPALESDVAAGSKLGQDLARLK